MSQEESSNEIIALRAELDALKEAHAQTWRPSKRMPMFAALGVGCLGALTPSALAFLPPSFAPFVSALCGGIAAGLAMYYGLRSGGQSPE